MTLRHYAALCLMLVGLLFTNNSFALDIVISISEKFTDTEIEFGYDSIHGSLGPSTGLAKGDNLEAIKKYSIVNSKLVIQDKEITKARNILFQGQTDGKDFVVISYSRNSFSSPWRLLRAFVGHPAVIKKITLLIIKDKNIINEELLTNRESYSSWAANVWKVAKN